MPTLMKLFSYITAHYRSGSHTISAVWPMLTYATEIAYSQFPLLPI